jgi:H+/Cl- antiporter ClcA
MKLHQKVQQHFCNWLEKERFHLSRPDALLHLALFGIISGFLAGGTIVLFRFIVENIQDGLLPGQGAENYEELAASLRFLLPVLSGLLLALLFYHSSKGIRVLGIAHVIERMAYHQGYLTLRAFLLQFFGAAFAIIGGHSVGREGPHVHLGASIASLFGQAIKAPNNSIRTMMACGSAAGIAASFNTPLAGVIFALEVVMMEYTLSSFIPVILASVVATALSNLALGMQPAFDIPEMHLESLAALPVVLVLGIIIGTFAALFNHLLQQITQRTKHIDIWWRLILAGIMLGCLGVIYPQILGIGYDTVNTILLGKLSLFAFFSLAIMKLLASSISLGLGVPAGMIGPAFFMGSALGGFIGALASYLLNIDPAYIGFYALLGMSAMVGASLQAPLAALTAVVELTYNPGIIMPSMLTIVVAQLTASELFRKKSLFIAVLQSHGLDYNTSPVIQVLRRIGVGHSLSKKYLRLPREVSYKTIEHLLQDPFNPIEWVIIDGKEQPLQALLPINDLAKHMHTLTLINPDADVNIDTDKTQTPNFIDLIEIPAKRLNLSPISIQANLQQAHEKLTQGAEALYVVFKEEQAEKSARIYGILTKEMIEKAYKI